MKDHCESALVLCINLFMYLLNHLSFKSLLTVNLHLVLLQLVYINQLIKKNKGET